MIYLLVILTGFVIILGMVQNAGLSTKVGLKQTSIINFFTGLCTALIFFLILGSWNDFNGLKGMNAFGYIGGILAVAVVLLSSFALSKISVIIGSMLIYTGQMIASFIIDYYMGISFSPMKLIGIALIVIGIYINNYIDYKNKEKML